MFVMNVHVTAEVHDDDVVRICSDVKFRCVPRSTADVDEHRPGGPAGSGLALAASLPGNVVV